MWTLYYTNYVYVGLVQSLVNPTWKNNFFVLFTTKINSPQKPWIIHVKGSLIKVYSMQPYIYDTDHKPHLQLLPVLSL